MALSLHELLRAAGITPPSGTPNVEVRDVVYDSRRVRPGSLFVAIPGFHVDGHDFAAAAVAAGAVAVVAQRISDSPPPASTPLIIVDDTRPVLAWFAAALAGHPSRRLTVAGITGTDGKTTTTTMLWAAWQAAGMRAGALTTVDFRVGDVITSNKTRQTTLEAVELQRHLGDMLQSGCECVAVETSSHALKLHRVDSIDYRVAVFTRVTSEHLDLHGSREAYLAAKARLLDLVSRRDDGIAIVDADDEFAFPVLRERSVANLLSYSAGGHLEADVRARAVSTDSSGVAFTADTPWGEAAVHLRLAGWFNANNALAAIAAACSSGAPLDAVVEGISNLDRVSGRMERIDMGQPFTVVIDYAHTADALAKVLRELRLATQGRLWVVFGSAGERDRDKRPALGRVAAELADIAVITDEDPREEAPENIFAEIAGGAVKAGGRLGETVLIIPDRHAAIEHAIAAARAGDTVLLAGKGHESCIIAGRDSVPYSERDAAEAALRRRL